MKKYIGLFGTSLLLSTLALLVSCEWEGSGSDDSFNSSGFSWVNFSGVYRAGGGGALVSDFTSGTTGSGTASSTNNVNNETIGQGNGANTTYSGVLNNGNLVAGSLSISAGGFNLVDNGTGSLSGGNATGAIDYGTGAWSIDLQGVPLGNGVPITADYSFVAPGTGGTGGGGSGSSGATIFQFTMFHAGNKITLTDNTGATYSGKFGKLQTTGGIDATTGTAIPSIGDSAVGEFTAKGTSSAGVSVMIVGTFQGVVSGGGASLFLSNRIMVGSWIEPSVQGNINGQAAPIGIAASVATN
jgi:hypothetical protein